MAKLRNLKLSAVFFALALTAEADENRRPLFRHRTNALSQTPYLKASLLPAGEKVADPDQFVAKRNSAFLATPADDARELIETLARTSVDTARSSSQDFKEQKQKSESEEKRATERQIEDAEAEADRDEQAAAQRRKKIVEINLSHNINMQKKKEAMRQVESAAMRQARETKNALHANKRQLNKVIDAQKKLQKQSKQKLDQTRNIEKELSKQRSSIKHPKAARSRLHKHSHGGPDVLETESPTE